MIHYHGTPLGGPITDAVSFFSNRHAFVSFASNSHLQHIAGVVSTFALDNGAFSFWKSGKTADWAGYESFVKKWRHHPAFNFCVIPDVIEGTEKENDELIKQWPIASFCSAPVWHLHESIERLVRLCSKFERVCFGSSGEFSEIGTIEWSQKIDEAFSAISTGGKIETKIHGLRMLNPSVFRKLPFASCDSTNVARNVTNSKRWGGTYNPVTARVKALVLADRIEAFQSSEFFEQADHTQKTIFEY